MNEKNVTINAGRKSHNNERGEKCKPSSLGIAEGIHKVQCQEGTGCLWAQQLHCQLAAAAAQDTTTTMPPALAVCPCSAEDAVLLALINVSLFMLSRSPFLLCLSFSLLLSILHAHWWVCSETGKLFHQCCFSVSQAFDVCLNCCSSASPGWNHRQRLLICRFRLRAEGPLPAGPPHAFLSFFFFLLKNYMLPPFLTISNWPTFWI